MNILSCFSLFLISVSLIVYYVVPGGQQWKVLLIASTLYFALCSPVGTAVMAVCSLSSFLLTKEIARRTEKTQKRIFLFSSIFIYLAGWLLVKVFLNMHGSNVFLFSTLNISETATTLGCSYFLLRYISYTVDVYNNKYPPEKSFGKLLLYYIYFPAIMQGPVERYGSFKERLFPAAKIKPTYENVRESGILLLNGLFKVFVISRFCALYTQSMNDPDGKNALFLLLAIFLYSFQIYTDFSGSIDIVRGLSLLFGIELSENFRLPYLSQSFSEFWKRWHITFSSWLKDYIYIPLGGSRCKSSRVYLNLLIVFAASGIWHGFSLPFLIWGLLQALYQIIERLLLPKGKISKDQNHPSTFLYICRSLKVFLLSSFAWIFFNAESLSDVKHLFSSIILSLKTIAGIGLHGFLVDALNDLVDTTSVSVKVFVFHIILLAVMVLFDVIKDRRGFDITDPVKVKVGFRWAYYIVMLILIISFGYFGDTFNLSSFIYGAF